MSIQPYEPRDNGSRLSPGAVLALWAYDVVERVDRTAADVTPEAGQALERELVRDRMLCGGVTSGIIEAALEGARLQRELFLAEIERMTT